MRDGGVVAVAVAIGVDAPHVVGAAGVRGAEPPAGGRAVQVRNALVQRRRTGSGLEVRQLRTIYREVEVVAGREANLVAGQQENLAEQAVSTALIRAAGTTILAIRKLYLLDCALNVAIKQVQECVI